MNREDIIRMAREAGIDIDAWEPLYEGDSAGFRVCEFTHVELERFAALVASAERERLTDAAMKAAEKAVDVAIALEREACAQFIEHEYVRQFERPWRVDLSAAIRARGQA